MQTGKTYISIPMKFVSDSDRHTLTNLISGIAFFCLCALYGCTTDVFDAEKVKATYQDRFPVKDIDPEMDWKMTSSLPVDIAVYEDWGTDYTVRVYTANPLDPASDAKLLGEGTANHDLRFSTTIDYPTTLQTLYAARIDAKGRVSVKPVDVSGGRMETYFGWTGKKAANETDASTRFTGEECPYTEAEIEQMLKEATEYNSKSKPMENGIYKMTDSYNSQQVGIDVTKAPNRKEGDIILIITPGVEWRVNKKVVVPDGVRIVVMPGASIFLAGSVHSLTFEGNSSLVVLGDYSNGGNDEAQGKIEGNSHSSIYFDNSGLNYNSGIIAPPGGMENNSDTFYNYGSIATESDLTGAGHITNHCIIRCATLEDTSIDMQPGSYLECDSRFDPGKDATLTMRDNSFVNVTGTASLDCDVEGPSGNGEQALFRLARDIESGTGLCTGHIHFETDASAPTLTHFIKNGDGQSDLNRVGHAGVYIEASPCNGNTGNQPVEQPDEELPDEAMPYTYVFEDNYPLVGDYDFNDVVLDVTTKYKREENTNNIRAIQLNITLAAAGAGKAVGAGLRIVDITPDDILQITSGGDRNSFHDSFNSPYNLFNFNAGTLMEEGTGSEVVIPIAGEVHDVLGEETGTLINTGAGNGATTKARTYKVIIELKDQSRQEPLFSKDNLDFFICYQYKHMQPRMEVHLFEFWNYGATTYGTILQDTNLDLAGNNTWAVCVPYLFRYPLETVNISVTSDPSAGAYPLFIDWAKNRSTNQDWYNYPNSDKVYR